MKQLPQAVLALISGALFGVGLAVSGMTKPAKVIGFLDVFGAWDASLVFVMMGAIAVNLLAYRLVRRRAKPVLAPAFALPTRRDIDLRLLSGAALFGVGWGVGGYCPGPALTSLPVATSSVVTFVVAMALGMLLASQLEARVAVRAPDRARRSPIANAPRSAPSACEE